MSNFLLTLSFFNAAGLGWKLTDLIENLLSLYGYILAGFIFGKILQSRRKKFSDVLTSIILDIILPGQVFFSLIQSNLQLPALSVVEIILQVMITFTLMAVTTYYYFRKKSIDKGKYGSYFLLNSLPNVLFYSIPIVLAVFPPALTIIVVIYGATQIAVPRSIATYVSLRLGSDVKPNWKQNLVALLKFPPFIAVIIGVICLGLQVQLPNNLSFLSTLFSQLSSGTSAFLVGMVLASLIIKEVKDYYQDIKRVAIWRFLISLIGIVPFIFLMTFPIYQTDIRTILFIIAISPPAARMWLLRFIFILRRNLLQSPLPR